MTAMGNANERSERIEALRELMERLCAPDLTLAEATPLRDQLAALLAMSDEDGDSNPATAEVPALSPGSRSDFLWQEHRSPTALMMTMA
jgi:hypothetical protein